MVGEAGCQGFLEGERGEGGASRFHLKGWVSGVIPRVPSVTVVSLDFSGKLRLLRAMHIDAVLHGAEASVVSQDGLRGLRTPFGQAGLSGGLRLADPGAVLSLLDGPVGCDPGYHVVWCTFRVLRRHMAYNSGVHELAKICGLLQVVSVGAPGNGPIHLLLSSASTLGFTWLSDLCVWHRPGLPALCQLSGRFQFFYSLLLGMLGEPRSLEILVLVLAFGELGFWIFGFL